MKARIKHSSPLAALIASPVMVLAGSLTAQTFTTLYGFSVT
jgi:hypothetical protein